MSIKPKFCVGDLTTEEGAIDFFKLNPDTTLSLTEIQAIAVAYQLGLPPEQVDYAIEFYDEEY